MLGEQLTDTQFFFLILLFLALALAGAALAISWPMSVADVLDHPDMRNHPEQRSGDWWR